ncbi:UNVERIFIED_CONTAM: hypothetical protein PYX00_002131 [Menopon gallinae]|uniref:Uncharacterized protein n=1 Tax=Menopon gallinae TaxID=328185 RepID=A0AAW2IG10_9NEOP
MRQLVLWLISAAVVGAAFAQESKLGERLLLLWDLYDVIERNCSAEIIAEAGDYDAPEDERCKMACALRKFHLLNDEGFSRRDMDRLVSFVFEDDPKLKSVSKDINLTCEKELAALKLTDECEIAWNVHQCLQKNWKQSGSKYWKPKWMK